LKTVAAALDTHPVLLVSAKKPEHAWTWTLHAFTQWKLGLLWNEARRGSRIMPVCAMDLVKVFLATRPEHRYARKEPLEHAGHAPRNPELSHYSLDADKWGREAAVARAGQRKQRRTKELDDIYTLQ